MITAYTFLDVEHPVVAWGTYRGVLVSANAEHQPPQCPVSMMFAGIILHQNNVRLHNELLIEMRRQIKHPHCVSRLAGMYFFDDPQQAQNAEEWGGHFKAQNLAEVELYPTTGLSRHDANWITYAPLDSQGRICDSGWIDDYWQGAAFPGNKPVWELIANGRAVICGTEIREKAYSILASVLPDCLSILEVARIAAHVGSDLGQTTAWITNTEEKLSLSFMLDMRDAENPTFLERLQQYKGPRNYEDLKIGGDYFRTPDFTEYSCQFRSETLASNKFLYSIHRNEKT